MEYSINHPFQNNLSSSDLCSCVNILPWDAAFSAFLGHTELASLLGEASVSKPCYWVAVFDKWHRMMKSAVTMKLHREALG